MKQWPVQAAKARFSELLKACLAQGPQMVTKHGAEAAVLVRVDEWSRLNGATRPLLKQLLLADETRGELCITVRGKVRRRQPVNNSSNRS
ncbi:MAG: type II toxin-antitoxin system Phd/YefM family antitoxin [Burkholderiaceae bacterium]|nr:type II toxin-antitoxin system Phd/YefM family antitoxin [Burkholderiaceae bacterium]MDZ4144211.1 type II toxin-antitoxin system Phd/YefM family antitoxin [Burkholderiales bacterium]